MLQKSVKIKYIIVGVIILSMFIYCILGMIISNNYKEEINSAYMSEKVVNGKILDKSEKEGVTHLVLSIKDKEYEADIVDTGVSIAKIGASIPVTKERSISDKTYRYSIDGRYVYQEKGLLFHKVITVFE